MDCRAAGMSWAAGAAGRADLRHQRRGIQLRSHTVVGDKLMAEALRVSEILSIPLSLNTL
jgi:hypothetical protein